jgi:hypothetical protein
MSKCNSDDEDICSFLRDNEVSGSFAPAGFLEARIKHVRHHYGSFGSVTSYIRNVSEIYAVVVTAKESIFGPYSSCILFNEQSDEGAVLRGKVFFKKGVGRASRWVIHSEIAEALCDELRIYGADHIELTPRVLSLVSDDSAVDHAYLVSPP